MTKRFSHPPASRVRPVALSIAGSDSGGGAGVQADLRTFSRLGCFGTTAITALTAQNLMAVTDVTPTPVPMVRAQIDAVLGGFDVRALKTGMLFSVEVVHTVAEVLQQRTSEASPLPCVVDPVMVATSGARLLQPEAEAAYVTHLFPQATLATPNLDEAEVLLPPRHATRLRELRAHDAPSLIALRDMALHLRDEIGCPVLLKGGHLKGAPVDVLVCRDGDFAFHHGRVAGVNSHGTGCTLSAAIAAGLAHSAPLVEAVADALGFVHDALENALTVTTGPQQGRDEVGLLGLERGSASPLVAERIAPTVS